MTSIQINELILEIQNFRQDDLRRLKSGYCQ
jgi:hypothetical protein